MSHRNRIIVTIFLAISIYGVGFAGCNYAPGIVWFFLDDPDSTGSSAVNAKWRQLPSPPVEVDEIVAADYFTVYVRTKDGRLLGCYRESRLDIRCWFELHQLPKMEADWDCEECTFSVPPEGVVVIQEYQIDYPEGRDTRSAFSYILDEDGQVWQWGFERFLYFGPPEVIWISLKASFWGCVIGMILPIIPIIVIWKREIGSILNRTKR